MGQTDQIDFASNHLPAEPVGGLDARFCEVMDAAPVMIWVSGQDKRCIWFNRPWLFFTGRSMAQELGDGWAQGVHPDDFDRCLQSYVDHFDARKSFRMQYRLRHCDGSYHWIDDAGVPRYARHGKFLGFIGSCVDLQAHTEGQDALRIHLMEIAHLNRIATAGELLASIAHEINQYLNAISTNGNAGLYWLDKGARHHSQARASLQNVIAAAQRAGDVVGSVRGMFKVGSQNRVALDCKGLIREVLTLLRSELERRKISLRTELQEDLGEVVGDCIQLQQVILNLIKNAMEAMDSVADRERMLKITAGRCGPRGVLISIEDSGIGLEPEQIGRIFEPFFTTKPQGMGMGLAICRSIIEAHGGRLFASHGKEHGVKMEITLESIKQADSGKIDRDLAPAGIVPLQSSARRSVAKI